MNGKTKSTSDALRLVLFGQVQGVSLRNAICNKGRELPISGYVRNQDDGTVEVVMRGERRKVEEMIQFCKNSPGYAKVREVSIEPIFEEGEEGGFTIRF